MKNKPTSRIRLIQLLLMAALLCMAVYALCSGVYHVSASNVVSILLSHIFTLEQTWTDTMYRVVMYSRFPRVIAAIMVGMALSLAGSGYQGVFRNPLVSPDLLGVSNGACIGVAISILLGLGYYGNLVLSFVGGILAVGLTVLFPRLMRSRSTTSLILSGVIVGGFFTSLLGILKYVADPDTELAEITYWQLGSLAKVRGDSLYILVPVILIFSLLLFMLRWRINAISVGDREAQALGVNLTRERGLLVLCSTVLTAASICLSGTISWIGLVVPHLSRMMVGHNNAHVLPTSALLGALFLVVVDTISRTLTGAEIPLGIITGLLGTPFFAFILINQRNRNED